MAKLTDTQLAWLNPSLCKPLPKALKLLGALFARHTGTDANMTGTDRNTVKRGTTLSDRYGAGVEKAGAKSLETGHYRDQTGRVWHCVVRETDVTCDSGGWFTCAYHDTFRQWGWEPLTPGGSDD